MRYDGSVVFSTKLDNTGFIKGIKGLPSALNGVKGALSKVGAAVGVAFGVRALVNFGKEAISLASDLEEVQNVVDTAFGSMKQKCEDFAKTSVKTLGMSELSAKQYSSTYMAMGRGMGQSMEDAADMAIETTKRVADVASFYNKSFSEVDTMMKSIWTGETESLKRIGVVMTETNLQAFALSKGITQNIADMDQATKTQLRYAFVMEQTALAAGDFQRTENSWANQTRLLSEQFNALKTSIGTGLIQALTPAVKALNQLLVMLTRIAEKFREVTATLFGKQTLPTENTADTVNELAAAEDNLAESTDKAAKSAERSLAGFDKLNKLGSNEAESASAAGTGGLSGSLGTVTMDTSQAQDSANQLSSSLERLKKMLEPLKKISFDNLEKSFNGLWKAAKKLGGTVWDGLEWAYYNILVPLSKWTIEEGTPAAVNLLAAAFNVLSSTLEALHPLAQWIWDNFLGPIARWTGGVVVSVLNGLATALNKISSWISSNQSIVQAGAIAVAAFCAAWKATELLAFIQMSGGVVAALRGITVMLSAATLAKLKDKLETIALTVMYAKDFIVSIAKGTAALAKQIVQWGLSTAAKAANTAATVAHTAASWAATAATTAFGAAMSVLTSPITLVIAAIALLVAGIVLLVKNWDTVKTTAGQVWDSVKSAWGTAGNWFETKVTAPIKSAFSGLWTSMKSKINNMLGGVEKLINGIINGINKLINNLNKLNVKIPEALGGGSIGFNIPTLSTVNIPRLAKGAVIPANREFLAVLGDQKSGQNIEAPESLIRKIVREEAGGAGGIKNITLILSSRLISEAVIEYHNGIVKRVGVTPLKGV